MIHGITATQCSRTTMFVPEIGDYWEEQGGFYIGAKLFTDNVSRHVIISDKSAEFTARFKSSNTSSPSVSGLVTGADITSMLLDNTEAHEAAAQCRIYNGGGFNDWSLPSLAEQQFFYEKLRPSLTTHSLWTASGAQAHNTTAYWTAHPTGTNAYQYTGNSNVNIQTAKTTVLRVRPFRTIKA